MIDTAENQIEQLRSLLRMAANDLNAAEQRAEAAERERDLEAEHAKRLEAELFRVNNLLIEAQAELARLRALLERCLKMVPAPLWDDINAALAAKGVE